MKKMFFIYSILVLFLLFPFLLGTANSSSLDVASVEQIRLPRPQIYKLNTSVAGLLIRETSLTISGGYVTGLSVTVANVGSSQYIFILVEVDVYNNSMDRIAFGFGFYFSFFNPVDPGEYVSIDVSLIPQVPINQTMYINVSVISAF